MPDNEDLLQYTDEQEIVDYLEHDTTYCYELETVSEYLKNILNDLSIQERTECAKLLYDHYGGSLNFKKLAPNFFVDEADQPIENGSILIRTQESRSLELPTFIKLRYLNSEQLAFLKEILGWDNDEALVNSGLAGAYGLETANLYNILGKIDDYVKDNPGYVSTYVRWLFDNREAIRRSGFTKFYLMTKDDSMRRSDGLYFSKEYLEDTPLEDFYGDSKIIAEPATFGIEVAELEEFRGFLKSVLRVADYPRRVEKGIDGLDEILKFGTTRYIIELMKNEQAYLKQNCGVINAQQKFKTAEWITKNGRRYAPCNIVLTSKSNYHRISTYINDDFLFISEDELLSGIQLEKSVLTWMLDEYLCINRNPNQLENVYIYKILNELPKFDKKGEISEDFYRDVITNNPQAEPTEESAEFVKFLDTGKVFCLDKQYHAVKDCVYLSKKYPRVIEAEYHFIDIVKSKSSDEIYKRLRIPKLTVGYELDKFEKATRADIQGFQEDIVNFKIFLLAEHGGKINERAEIAQLKELNIILCKSLSISYEDKTGDLENYEFVKEQADFYLKVPGRAFSELKNNDKFQDAVSEIFKSKFTFLNKDATARIVGLLPNDRIERVGEMHGNNAWSKAEKKLGLTENAKKDFSGENLENLVNLRNQWFSEYERRLFSKLYNAPNDDKAKFVTLLNEYREYDFEEIEIPSEEGADMLEVLYGVFPLLTETFVPIGDIDDIYKSVREVLFKRYPDEEDLLSELLEAPYYESLLRFGESAELEKKIQESVRERNLQVQRAQAEKSSRGDGTAVNNQDEKGKDDGVNLGEVDGIEIGGGEGDMKSSGVKEVQNAGVSGWQSSKNVAVVETTKVSGMQMRGQGRRTRPTTRRGAIKYSDVEIVEFEQIGASNSSGNKKSGSHSLKLGLQGSKKQREKRAKAAEKLVFNNLAKLGYKNIEWVSAYAKDEGVNLNGVDGYGYDIQGEKNGKIRYIEVKSSVRAAGIEFEISENELNFCRQHAKNYDIAYVYDMDSSIPKMAIIENVYGKINNSNKFPTSYKVRLK